MDRNDFNPQCITYGQMKMIITMRIYYRRLINLTRIYIRNRYYNLGKPDVLFDRLYLEYMDLGSMLHLNFGRTAQDQYSQYLGQFAIDLRELISAQIAGNKEGINENLQGLYNNVNTRAEFLKNMNPFWDAEAYKNLFYSFIQYLIQDANALSTQNFNQDIALYDQMIALTNKMGDTFAEGIYNFVTSGKNLSPKEGEPCITYEQLNNILQISMFWFDLEVWLRNYMISKYLNIGDKDAVFQRLQKVVADFTNEWKNIYGENFASVLSQKLNEYLNLINQFTTAQLTANNEEVNRLIQLLYQNTDSRVAMQAQATSSSEDVWRSRLRDLQVQGIINESTALLANNITRSLDIFLDLLTEAESMSDFVSRALFDYFAHK